MSLDAEGLAKTLAATAGTVVSSFSPLGGVVFAWASEVAFEIYDAEKNGSDAVAIAQLAGDRTVDLIESLKTGGK
jgi:hypothetical protein